MSVTARLFALIIIAYAACTLALTELALTTPGTFPGYPSRSLLALFAALLLFVFIPIAGTVWYGVTHAPRHNIAAATLGLLVWILLIVAQALLNRVQLPYWIALDLLANLALCAVLIRKYRFPTGYIVLALLLSWLAPLYFLVFGPLRTTDSAHALVVV